MSIQTTIDITRKRAIHRIRSISELVESKHYRRLDVFSHEPDEDVGRFIDTGDGKVDTRNLDKWTNHMLEEVMDKPFYRYSMFENYRVVDEEED